MPEFSRLTGLYDRSELDLAEREPTCGSATKLGI